MPARIDRTERLLNLLFAFMAAGQPMTRAQVRDIVAGYQESSSDEAFERMFERDKDELRSLGIPVTTVMNASGEVEGYHIPKEAYALEEIAFTSSELGALTLAAQAWDEAVFAPAATMALRKLEASMPSAKRPDLPSALARIDASETQLAALVELLTTDVAIGFAYRKVGSDHPEQRTVTPISLVSRHGHWYLVASDHDRDDVRVFRVSRIEGRIVAAGPRRTVPVQIDAAALIDQAGEAEPGIARIRVEPEQAMTLRRMGVVDGDEVEIEYSDQRAIARQLVAAGSAVVVLSPPQLRDMVQALLQGVLNEHSR